MEAQRALLDQLLGKDRDVTTKSESKVSVRHFSDSDVDKYFLVGCSPYELLKGTKSDSLVIDTAHLVRDEECKRQWEALDDKEKERYGYEEETRRYLERTLRKCDRNISHARSRVLAEEEADIDSYVEKIMKIDEDILFVHKQIEPLAMQGLVSRAFQLNAQLLKLHSAREDLLKVPDQKKQQIVCPVTGKLIARGDDDHRLRCYFEGKQYLGWRTIREMLDKLNTKRNQRIRRDCQGSDRESSNRLSSSLQAPDARRHRNENSVTRKSRDSSREMKDEEHSVSSRRKDTSAQELHRRDRSSNRYRDRSRDQNRDRSRDRYRDRSRDRDRDRSRDQDRDRSRDRYRDRSRDRDRDRSRDQDRDRSRDRYRDRSRDRYCDRSRDRYRDRSRDRYRDKSRERDRDRGKNRDRDRSRDRYLDRDRNRDEERKRDRERYPFKDEYQSRGKDLRVREKDGSLEERDSSEERKERRRKRRLAGRGGV